MTAPPKYRLTEQQDAILVRAYRHHAQPWSAKGLSWEWSAVRWPGGVALGRPLRPTPEQVRRVADGLVGMGLAERRQFSAHRHGYRLTDEGRAEAERRA